jgi:hypothetical protein
MTDASNLLLLYPYYWERIIIGYIILLGVWIRNIMFTRQGHVGLGWIAAASPVFCYLIRSSLKL